RQGVRHAAHDEAVEQRHRACGAGAREDASRRQKAMSCQRFRKGQRRGAPLVRCLSLCRSQRDPRPGLFNRTVQRRPVGRLEAVLHVPDLMRKRLHGTGFLELYCGQKVTKAENNDLMMPSMAPESIESSLFVLVCRAISYPTYGGGLGTPLQLARTFHE